MAYKKRYKKRYKKKSYNKGSSTLQQIGSVASTALNIAKFAASVLNVEDKYLDRTINGQPFLANGVQLALNMIPQGTDNVERIGRQIRVKSLELNINIAALVGSDTVAWLKYYIVIDKKHSGGSMFPLTEYLTAQDEVSFRNMDYSNRFKTLKKRTVTIIKNTNKHGIHLEEYFDLTNLPESRTEYDGIGATIGDISAYPIYIVYVSSASNAGKIDVRGVSRLKFVDN